MNDPLRTLSKRSDQMAEHVANVCHTSHRGERIAALATQRLNNVDPDEDLMQRWRNELEVAADSVEPLAAAVAPKRPPDPLPTVPLTEAEINQLAAEVFDPQGVFLARHRAFTRTDLVAEVGPKLYGRNPAELDVVLEAILAVDRVVELPRTPGAREQAYALRCAA